MNVLQILPELNAGGVERTTVEVAEALLSEGHSAHVASNGGRMVKELRDMGAVLHTLKIGSKNPLLLRRNTKALIDIIKTHNIDIVHARSRAPAWPAHTAARATGIPFITTYHGIYNAKTPLKRRYNAIMAQGDMIIANSEYTKAHIISEHGVDPDIIKTIPRGVDITTFDPEKITPSQIKAFRDMWQVSDTETALVLPGRLTRWKGQAVAIQAMVDIPQNVILILMGDAQGRTKYESELRDLVETLGLTNRVRFVDHCTDMPSALMAANIVLSASTDPEAFGRISAEAQAMGRPVVATAHGGTLETVLDGVTGFHIQPGDAVSLAEGVKRALDWPEYDAKVTRWRIVERFSKSRLQSETLEVYDRVYDLTT